MKKKLFLFAAAAAAAVILAQQYEDVSSVVTRFVTRRHVAGIQLQYNLDGSFKEMNVVVVQSVFNTNGMLPVTFSPLLNVTFTREEMQAAGTNPSNMVTRFDALADWSFQAAKAYEAKRIADMSK